MDIKHEIFIKEELSEGLAIEEAPSEGIKDYCRGEIEFYDTNAQAYEQKSGWKEFGDESCDSNINIKTEIEIKEDPFGIKMEDAEIHESLNQTSRINEKDLIEEYPNKNSDMFERSRHEGLKTENEVTEHHYMKELSCSNYNFVSESEDELVNELESCEEKVKCSSRCSSPCNCEPNLKLKILNGDADQSIFFKAKLFKCCDCSFECNHKGNLKTHLLLHQNKKLFKCSECDSEFKRKGDLKRHVLIHQETKLFKCSECNFECNSKKSLKLHVLKHRNIKLFKCSKCSYECNQKGDMKRHMLVHQTTKLFKCSDCTYECNIKRNLIVHMLKHQNIKLFKCSECNYECNEKVNLKRHMLKHQDIKLFKCPECSSNNYKRKGSLREHMLKHH